MESSFFFSSNIKNYLFHGVNIETTLGFLSLMMGFASLCFLWEGLKVAQLHLVNAYDVACCTTRITSKDKLISVGVQTLLYSLGIFIGYTVMLSIMTYNTWFFISGAVGSFIGYWCFDYLNQTIQIFLLPKCGQHRGSCDRSKLTMPNEDVDGAVEFSDNNGRFSESNMPASCLLECPLVREQMGASQGTDKVSCEEHSQTEVDILQREPPVKKMCVTVDLHDGSKPV